MKLRVLLICLSCLIWASTFAVPAKRERCILTLSDGSKIEAVWMGDESFHFYKTDDGRYLQCDEADIAHFITQETVTRKLENVRRKRKEVRAKRNMGRRKRAGEMTGSKRGLVILVQFPDVPFLLDPDIFQHFFNDFGYQDDINIGSVRDYYRDASYGQFDFSFDVVGPIMMKDSLRHYGGNNANGDDVHPAEMAIEAVKEADGMVDFSQYDWDGDGEVEQIFVLHSGYDEAQSRKLNDIWSHAWYLSEALEEGDGDGPVTVDGVVVDSYATGAELRGKNGAYITGIGTACHEFAHQFGLPDFYDTKGNNFGMSTWSLMDYGEYNGGGGVPAGFTSYERMFCGWLSPTELTSPVSVRNMPAITSAPECYIIRNSGKADEYYLLENRQKEGWDECLDGHGMLILHVDYDSTAWADNTVNTVRSHQRMTLIPADNILYIGTLSGDPWPGSRGKTELTAESIPAATLFHPNAEGDLFMNHSITEITESADGLISFIFDEKALGIDRLTPFGENSGEGLHQGEAGRALWSVDGRRWRQPEGGLPRGIYITNGKKVLIR